MKPHLIAGGTAAVLAAVLVLAGLGGGYVVAAAVAASATFLVVTPIAASLGGRIHVGWGMVAAAGVAVFLLAPVFCVGQEDESRCEGLLGMPRVAGGEGFAAQQYVLLPLLGAVVASGTVYGIARARRRRR